MSKGLKYMFIAQFFKASSLKKINPITFIVWVLGSWLKKCQKKRVKKSKNLFFVVSDKYQDVTHVLHPLFKGFLLHCALPYALKIIIYKNPLNF